MSAEIELISTMGEKKLANRPPIQMEFQVTLYLFKNLIVSLAKMAMNFPLLDCIYLLCNL
jgi:AP-2 complex subunit mu-1